MGPLYLACKFSSSFHDPHKLLVVDTIYSAGTQNTGKNVALSLGVEIVCTTCYIKGIATAQLTMAESFNISQAIQKVTTQVEDAISNITLVHR